MISLYFQIRLIDSLGTRSVSVFCYNPTFLFYNYRPGGMPQYVIIKDASKDPNIEVEDIEQELERAFEEEAQLIIIEPTVLGNEVAKWIALGNFLHKASVISGLLSFGIHRFDKSRYNLIIGCGTISSLCAITYAVCWKDDPCCKFQVAEQVPDLEHMVTSLGSANPVVLVRRNDSRRKVLHNIIASLTGALCASKLFAWMEQQ